VVPIIIHIPHASRKIPSDIRRSLLLSDSDLEEELTVMTDAFTDELFDVVSANAEIFPVSRLVLDPERFIDDNQEMMAALGMGVIYTCTSSGQRLRHPPTSKERAIPSFDLSSGVIINKIFRSRCPRAVVKWS